MKYLINYIIVFIVLLACSCDKDSESNPIECDITYGISSVSLTEGEHLYINNFKITPKVPLNGIEIQKVEFYLGNRNIGSCYMPPYELDYIIPNLPVGEHQLQIDVHLTADGFDNTIIWLRRNIRINETQTIE